MPLKAPSFGVSKFQFGLIDKASTAPALNASTVVLSPIAPTVFRKYTSRPLIPAGDYNVYVAYVGYDPAGGYAIARSSATPGSPVTLNSGEYIGVRIATQPSGFAKALGAAVLIQDASEDPKIVDVAYVPMTGAFSWMLTSMGSPGANRISVAELTSINAGEISGSSRTPYGVEWSKILKTTGGMRFRHPVESTEVDPDDGSKYSIPVARKTNVEFSQLTSALADLGQATGGEYVKFTDAGSNVIEQYSGDINDIVSALSGNTAMKVLRPVQAGGRIYYRLMFGNLGSNNSDVVEDEQKLKASQIDWVLEGANIDTLFDGVPTTVFFSNGT